MVPVESASLMLDNEQRFPVNADHSSICRYESNKDDIYDSVKWAIDRIINRTEDEPALEATTELSKEPLPALPTAPQSLGAIGGPDQQPESPLIDESSQQLNSPQSIIIHIETPFPNSSSNTDLVISETLLLPVHTKISDLGACLKQILPGRRNIKYVTCN